MTTQPSNNPLLAEAEVHIRQFFNKRIPPDYVFHDLQHTMSVVESVGEIGEGFQLTEEEMEILQFAAWFHDLGYDQGPQGHEERGASYAREFLEANAYPEERIQEIERCILGTKFPQKPETKLERILCDADLSHLGKRTYWDRCARIQQEMFITRNIKMTQQEWLDFEMNFLDQHNYHTEVASQLYNKRKQKHYRQLEKQKRQVEAALQAGQIENAKQKEGESGDGRKKKKDSKNSERLIRNEQEIKQLRLGRGVETMYRTTYRTHVNLSSIADNKANIMLSINAIIISIVVSTLVPRFEEDYRLILPTVILLIVCLTAVVYATLSTRPKVTEGKFTRDDIENKRSNLLFFGNYYNMSLDDFNWGMMEMIKDSDFLYNTMTRDLYFLGKVLAKKYRYLSICYTVFMYGLIASVAVFALSILFLD